MSKVAWFSCHAVGNDLHAAYAINSIGVDAAFMLGDTPYTDSPLTAWGITATQNSGDDPSQANFETFQSMMRAVPGLRALEATCPVYYMPDDHEWPGDNWDHTTTQASARTGAMTAPTQADVDAAFKASWDAIDTYYDWPSNTDAEAVAEKPSGADAATPVGNYPVRYHRLTIGDIEFFVLDCISYRDPLATVASASKTLLGANQKAWLKARLKASTATFKAIVCSKKTYATGTTDNGDIFGASGTSPGYEHERDELLGFIHSATDWAVPGGVFWLAGDRHTPQICRTYAGEDGYLYDHICVCACPVGVGNNSSSGTTTTAIPFVLSGKVFGLVEELTDRVRLSMRDSITGAVVWYGYVLAGENKLSYPAIEAAI